RELHYKTTMGPGLANRAAHLPRGPAPNPAVLGPGVPTPFRCMFRGPAADGRSVTSPVDGRTYDTGAWPPRPTGVRFAHPGWQGSANACMEQSQDGRFTATWIWGGETGGRLWGLPPPPRPARAAARRSGTATGTPGRPPLRPVRPARNECGPLDELAGVEWPAGRCRS